MAATRTAARGLSTDQLTSIRDGLAAGRKPKVTFTESAGQVAGQTGQVVALTDPETSDDWVVVRFGGDELPFSPADLAITGRAPRGSGPAAKRAAEPPPPPPEFMITPRPTPRHRRARAQTPVIPASAAPASADAATVSGSSSAAGSATANGSLAGNASAAVPLPGGGAPGYASPGGGATDNGSAGNASAGNASATGGSVASGSAARPARKATKPKGPAGLTVTLAYGDGEWTLAAQQGSKALAKPYVIKPAEALKIVSLVDVPGVHEAVEHIMAAERAQAQAQAEKLRTELAEIEARLAELREV